MRLLSALATAAFFTVARCRLITQPYDQDDQGPFPEPKYFREAAWDDHYDERYAKERLSELERHEAVVALVQSYLIAMDDLQVQTWLMHGTLLGWWWGKHVMPWDPDADFQIREPDMFFLAAYHNMTTYRHESETAPNGRDYLLEINPHFAHRDQDDALNVIDARWIDTVTGLYVDVTAARYALDHKEGEGVMFDKNGHEFRDTYLYPLLPTKFEGAPVLIPYRYKDMLESEYGAEALSKREYKGYAFSKEEMRWMKGS